MYPCTKQFTRNIGNFVYENKNILKNLQIQRIFLDPL